MGLELVEQFGWDDLPDVIMYPTGACSGLGRRCGRQHAELEGEGLISPTPSCPSMVATGHRLRAHGERVRAARATSSPPASIRTRGPRRRPSTSRRGPPHPRRCASPPCRAVAVDDDAIGPASPSSRRRASCCAPRAPRRTPRSRRGLADGKLPDRQGAALPTARRRRRPRGRASNNDVDRHQPVDYGHHLPEQRPAAPIRLIPWKTLSFGVLQICNIDMCAAAGPTGSLPTPGDDSSPRRHRRARTPGWSRGGPANRFRRVAAFAARVYARRRVALLLVAAAVGWRICASNAASSSERSAFGWTRRASLEIGAAHAAAARFDGPRPVRWRGGKRTTRQMTLTLSAESRAWRSIAACAVRPHRCARASRCARAPTRVRPAPTAIARDDQELVLAREPPPGSTSWGSTVSCRGCLRAAVDASTWKFP